jgi:hypothetical protein
MNSERPISMDEIRELAGGLLLSSGNGDSSKQPRSSLPAGFRMTETGLYLIGEDDKPDIYVCGPLEVAGQTRDRHNQS